jgi:hypothetical protein
MTRYLVVVAVTVANIIALAVCSGLLSLAVFGLLFG